ncbi:17084_t:CDS:2, partial [Racocetra persica]
LYWAAEYRHTEIVKFLLEVEAEADNKPNLNLVYFATERNYENVVKLLLKEKACHSPILHYVAGKGDIKIIKFLLENRDSIDDIDKDSRTLLHWAAFEDHKKTNGHIEIIQILIENGADINAINKNDWKPIHIAIISCSCQEE